MPTPPVRLTCQTHHPDQFELDITKLTSGLTTTNPCSNGNPFGYFYFDGAFTHHDGLVCTGYPLALFGIHKAIKAFLRDARRLNNALAAWKKILSTQTVNKLRKFIQNHEVDNNQGLSKEAAVEVLAKYAMNQVSGEEHKRPGWVFHEEAHSKLVNMCTRLPHLKALCNDQTLAVPVHPKKIGLVSDLLEAAAAASDQENEE